MASKLTSVWGLNEKGEIVATAGTGTTNVVGYVNQDCVPLDESGKLVVAGLGGAVIVSAAAPSNADGMPDGTLYIQVPA